jgi:hypothetical protein
MDSIKKQARRAGLLYFLACLTAPFSLIYVPNQLIVSGDATATADRLRASANLLRLGIAGELVNAILIIFAVLALYRLLKRVDANQALAMVVLLLVSVPVSLLNVVNNIAALTLVSGADFLSVLEPRKVDAWAYFFLRLHGQGLVVAQIFWGIWLFPYGILVMRSGFIPRVLGVLLVVAGFGYVLNSIGSLFVPHYAHAVGQVATLLEIGEVPILLWLLIKGARDQPRATQPADPAIA